MKYLAPLFVIFALLTDPQGQTIYISRDQVTAVMNTSPRICSDDSHARLLTLSGTICIAESPDDARRKLEEAK